MTKREKKKLFKGVFLLIAAAIVALAGRYAPELMRQAQQEFGLAPASVTTAQGELAVHFIDVGQADCILIQAPEQNVLIDAGDRGVGEEIEAYLRAQNVSRIDLLIATHPHADHIGSMDYIVSHFDIGKILFGEVPDDILPTSKTYENLLDAISDKGMRITKANPGDEYTLGGGAKLTVLAPLKAYDDLNNTSVVTRLDFAQTSYIFTGDAETESEKDILKKYPHAQLQADVLKLGHHGSSTSSSRGFLEAVSPQIAIASCGTDNSYGHPHKETLQKLSKMGITLYRTDMDGTIVIASDGDNLSVSLEKAA